jgi:HEAT repeat protein
VRTSEKVLVIFCFSIVLCPGCGANDQPIRAGGKPVEHWLKVRRDSDPKVRKMAVVKLGNIGPDDAAVRLALIEALRDRDSAVRCQAVLALVHGGTEPEIKAALESATKDKDSKVRGYAVDALKQLEGGNQ